MFDWDYFLISLLRAFILIVVTYNPTGWSFVGILGSQTDPSPFFALLGTILLSIGYVGFYKQFMKHLGGLGIVVLFVLFFCFLAMIAEWLVEHRHSVINHIPGDWFVIFVLSIFMAVGVSIRREI